MGFHKTQLPKLKVLKRQFNEMGIENFVELYGGLECSVGSADSMNFIEEKEREWLNIINSDGGQKVDRTNH